jgi:hypothetical protein
MGVSWIPSIVQTLFSYLIRSHFTPNYTRPWSGFLAMTKPLGGVCPIVVGETY